MIIIIIIGSSVGYIIWLLNIFLFIINKIVEEDINELEDEPKNVDQGDVEVKEQNKHDKTEENQAVSRRPKEINRSMEDDASVLPAPSKENVAKLPRSQRTSRNEVGCIPQVFLNLKNMFLFVA